MENKLSAVESALVTNDLSKLTTEQRMGYYKSVCDSVGLNPLTQPLSYIQLNGKLTLYAKRDATDQLRKIHNISINITSREKLDDVYIVTAKAKDSSGREDESIGSVSISGLKGDALANAYMKCETKAKRRVTLSICGLGLLDESETDSIKGAELMPQAYVKDVVPIEKPVSAPVKPPEQLAEVIKKDTPPKTKAPPVKKADPVVEDDADKQFAVLNAVDEATITKEMVDSIKTEAAKKGYDSKAVDYTMTQATGKNRWGLVKVTELEEIRRFLK